MNVKALPANPGQEAPAATGSRPGRILVVNADRATFGLLAEWLTAAGYEVVDAETDAGSAHPGTKFSAAIVDVPFTRHGGAELAQRVSAQHPGTPILAMSATFFSNVKCSGECARALGVAGVLPKPVGREALVGAVKQLVDDAG
jgi:DNA-binding response OmpR family regulator